MNLRCPSWIGRLEIEDQTEFRLGGTTFLLLVADD